MKLRLKYFILMLSLLGSSLYGAAPAADSPKQRSQSQPNDHRKITQLIAAHLAEVIKNGPKEYPWLPGYYLKSGSDRIKGAQALRECIYKHNLNLVTVPEKWSVPIDKSMLDDSTAQHLERMKHAKVQTTSDWHMAQFAQDPCIIISKKLIADPKACMTLDQAKHVYYLLTQAQCNGKYYADAHANNVVLCIDGTVGFIDTELEGFSYVNTEGLTRILEHAKITREAQEFLQQKLNVLIPSQFPATPRLIVKPFKD